MARYLYGAILTGPAVASNNRGENSGNMAMLQHVFWGGHDHTTVSSEAIRFAIRLRAQLEDKDQVNRVFDVDEGKWAYRQKDVYDPEKFADDDILGFMNAQAAKESDSGPDEGEAASSRGRKPKGTITKRRSPLAVARAVSLEPYQGELSFGSAAKEKDSTSLFSAEVHTTRYQYAFGLSLGGLKSAIERRLSSTGSWTLPPWRARTRGSCSTSRPRSSCSRSATATLTGFCIRSTGPRAAQPSPGSSRGFGAVI